jgi:hypothetical protein
MHANGTINAQHAILYLSHYREIAVFFALMVQLNAPLFNKLNIVVEDNVQRLKFKQIDLNDDLVGLAARPYHHQLIRHRHHIAGLHLAQVLVVARPALVLAV